MKLDAKVWIALSAQGHPAVFLGYAYTRKALDEACQHRHGHNLKDGGYRPVRVRLVRDA